jgi:hypothetical protein
MENRTYRALEFSLRHVWIGPIFFLTMTACNTHHSHFHFVLARLVEAFPTTHCSFRVPLRGAQEFKYCMVRGSHGKMRLQQEWAGLLSGSDESSKSGTG